MRTLRLEPVFEQLRARGEIALIAYLTAGDPSLEQLPALLQVLQESGVDMVEVGFPFSDPLADGPVIQAAMYRALQRGTTLPRVLETVAQARASLKVPLIAFTYYNPVQRYGLERFAREAVQAGFTACLMTDLPPDEADEWLGYAYAYALQPIFLLTPTSTTARIRLVAEKGRGFIYCVSRTGVTGAREQLPPDLPELVARIRQHTQLPIAVGFGVSKPEHVRQIAQIADGAVVGSQLVQMMHEHASTPHWQEVIGAYVRALKAATKHEQLAPHPKLQLQG
ncbi:MAG: tryptophan synthase subunit alpha [Armatimonadota bacterium]|nr:tryptophan synthase subunit alpha [Armatimonadota bacterium]